MKAFEIIINGEAYPCSMTMGAFIDFKEVTGTDLSKADMTSISDNATFMWCVVRSSCRKNKRGFNYTLNDFCDNVDMETLATFQLLLAENMGDYQKKMTEKKTS